MNGVHRWAAAAGVAGPVGFLTATFALAGLRSDVIAAQGWVSWPSSMALGGTPGIPMIAAFLWLAVCYSTFSLGALRPGLRFRSPWIGFLGIAAGDLLLAFPTDERASPPTWHGSLHLAGVVLVTVCTLVAAIGVTVATLGMPAWRPWRLALPVPFLATAIGAAAGFDAGWAKVTYVVGITLPAAVVGGLLLAGTRGAPVSRTVSAARSG